MASTKRDEHVEADTNPDPITGEHGSHPVGVGLGGAAGGAAAGALVVRWPARSGRPWVRSSGPWRGDSPARESPSRSTRRSRTPTGARHHKTRPYVDQNSTYDDYRPAYQYGWESRARHADKSFDEVESDLGRNWETAKAKSKLSWDKAKHATRDAWDRVVDPLSGNQNQGR